MGPRAHACRPIPAAPALPPPDDLPPPGAEAGRRRHGHVPLGNEFTLEQKRRNFEYYDPITTGDSSLSASIQSIVASEIGNEQSACRYLDFALMMDLADVAGNMSSGVHIASAAGGWMGLVFGFGGVRDFDGRLTIDPHLPKRFGSLGFSLRFHDRQIRVRLSHDGEQYWLTEGDPLEVVIRGQRHVLSTNEVTEVGTSANSGRPTEDDSQQTHSSG